MKRVSVLDCTLRDGGYCNNWKFGKNNIKRVIDGLFAANIEYIECGYLIDRIEYDENRTKFSDIRQIDGIIPEHKVGKVCCVMVNYGEYSIEKLPKCSETCIDGIRVAFRKNDFKDAIRFCAEIKKKGYLVFVQPMVSMSYSGAEFIELIQEVNRLKPYAFYIVDSFGMMKRKALMQLVELTDINLQDDIILGFHAHNNLQLAYSNAQYLTEHILKRSLIIDVSVHGMGRGAGNLNAELFLDYLNETLDAQYSIRPILNLMDEIISRFYEEKSWGYSLPNYLSAIHLLHPNYATYLNDKKTLTLEAMDEIFGMIEPDKGIEYDTKYIESLYIEYLSRRDREDFSIIEIEKKICGRKVLLIAPGKSVVDQKDKIIEFVEKEQPVIFSINHDYPYYESDYIFVSNMRRFRELNEKVYDKTIITSNIKSKKTYACVEYHRLLNSVEGVRDNAGLMAIKFLAEMGVSEFFIAGFDGYSYDVYNNFETRDMALLNSAEFLVRLNDGIRQVIKMYAKTYEIHFVTDSMIVPENNTKDAKKTK